MRPRPDSELGLERSLCACLRPRPFVRPRNELPQLSQRKMKLLRRCRSQSGVPADRKKSQNHCLGNKTSARSGFG